MKKLALFVMFAIAGSLFLASCSGGDDPETPKPKPTVTWKTTGGFKTQDGTETAGNDISFGVLATPSSGEKITKVVLTLAVNGGATAILLDSTLKEASFDKDWVNIPLGNLPNSKSKYTATVTQSNGQSQAVAFTITATAPPRGVQANNGIQLGAQNNTTVGSFFNAPLASTGVMFQAQANSDQGNVHVIYYSGANNKETFSAANDAQITQVFANISNWTVKNATTFKKTTMTATDFDNIPAGDATIIDNQCTNGVFVTKVTQLAVGDVIAYRTQDGNHYALFKVTSISAGSNGSITFDMKNPLF